MPDPNTFNKSGQNMGILWGLQEMLREEFQPSNYFEQIGFNKGMAPMYPGQSEGYDPYERSDEDPKKMATEEAKRNIRTSNEMIDFMTEMFSGPMFGEGADTDTQKAYMAVLAAQEREKMLEEMHQRNLNPHSNRFAEDGMLYETQY